MNTGKVVQVMGPVIDVKFDQELPEINHALTIDVDAKEAICFAILANETLFCRPGNLPSASGARGERILGKIILPTPKKSN